jgi:excisionase family DNA binding protein
MVRHWPADQIGPFSWFGLPASRKPATQFGPAAYQAATLEPRRIKGICGSENPAPIRNKEPSCNARPQYSDLPESPLPEKEQCIMIGSRKMAQLHTPAEAAEILRIRESWLRAKAAARAIPCTFIGKHLRFSDDDIAQIMAEGARQPVTRGRGTRR